MKKIRMFLETASKWPLVGPHKQLLTEAMSELESEEKPILVLISGVGAWSVPNIGYNVGHLVSFAEAGNKDLMKGFVINLFGSQQLAPRQKFDAKYYSEVVVL